MSAEYFESESSSVRVLDTDKDYSSLRLQGYSELDSVTKPKATKRDAKGSKHTKNVAE